jgi:hypothetical protein
MWYGEVVYEFSSDVYGVGMRTTISGGENSIS